MMTDKHSDYMGVALGLARKGLGSTRPNPPVGAVVVRGEAIVGEGFHPRAGEPHAEVFALREAADATRGADLYVTLEPCCHTGRTGPCTEAIIDAGIERVFVGVVDPNPKVSGQGIARLREAGIEVSLGILEESCRDLIAPFTHHLQTGMPLILYKGAVTLDGVTATRSGDSRWVSCEESRVQVHQLRHQVDAILVGIGTVLADNPRLTTRLPGTVRHPDRVIVDSTLRIPEDAVVLDQTFGGEIIIATTSLSDGDKLERLQQRGIKVLVLPQDDSGQVDALSLCTELGRRDYQNIMLEGGATLAKSLWSAKLIQRVRFYLAPKIYAGGDGIPLFSGAGTERMGDVKELVDVRFSQCGSDIVIEGNVA